MNVLEIIKLADFQKLEDIPDMVVFPADNELRFFPDDAYSGEPPLFESNGNDHWVKFAELPVVDLIDPSLSEIKRVINFIFSGGIVSFLLDPEINASYRDAMMFAKNMYCMHLLSKKGQLAVDNFNREYLVKMCSGQFLKNLELPVMVGYSSNEGTGLKYHPGGRFIRFTVCWNVSAGPLVKELTSIALKESHKKFVKTERDRSALAHCYARFLSRTHMSCERDRKCPEKNYKNIISKTQQFWKDVTKKNIDVAMASILYEKIPLTIARLHDTYCNGGGMNLTVPIPTRLMRSANTASTSLENNSDIMVIDKDEDGWPVAVTRKFGHGAVVFLPSCVDMEDLKSKLSAINAANPGARGWSLLDRLVKTPVTVTVQLTGEIQENDIKNTLAILVSEGDGLRGRKDRPQKLLVKLNTRPAIKVPINKLIQFLVLWIHSVKGKGIMYCSDSNWNEFASKSGYSQIMALNATGNKECVIGGKIVLPDKAPTASHIQYFKRDIVSVVIFGKQPRKVNTKQGKEKQRDNTKLLDEIFTKQDSYEEDIDYQVWRLQIKIKPLDEPVILSIEQFMARDEKLSKCKDVFMTAFKDAITSQQ